MSEQPSLRDLETFVAVAECGGVARAALALGYTQPGVTLQVQRLERVLGVTLFDRRARQLVLSPSGHRAIEPARRLLEEARRFKGSLNENSELDVPILTVAVLEPSGSACLAPMLSKLRERSFSADVKLVSLGGDSIVRAAEARAIDAAVTTPARLTGWVFEPLFEERLVALVPFGHPLASQKAVSLSRLSAETLVLTDESCVYRRTIQRAFARSNARLSVAVESGSVSWLPNAVAAGLGVAIVPRTTTISSELRFVPIREHIDLCVGILRPANVRKDSALSLFLSAAQELRH